MIKKIKTKTLTEMCCVPLKIQGLHRRRLFLALSKTARKKFEWGMSSFSFISSVDSEISS